MGLPPRRGNPAPRLRVMDPAARREGAARTLARSSGEAEAKALQVLQRLHAEPGRWEVELKRDR